MFELWQEVVRITAWKDDSVYRTSHVECGWYDQDKVDGNKPRDTNLMYVVCTHKHAPTLSVRKKR